MTDSKKKILKHIGFWVCFWFIQSLLFSGGSGLDFYLAKNLVIVGLQLAITYFNWYILFKLIASRRYILFGILSVVIVYLIYSIAYTMIDFTLSSFYPNVISINPYQFKWNTSFWSVLSGSAPYSLALLSSTVFLLIKKNNSLSDNPPQNTEVLDSELEKNDEEEMLMLKEGKVIHRLKVQDILFVQGMKEYVSWHTKDKKLITLHSLTSLEDQLSDKGFLRTHKSFIVNKNCVSAIRYDCLEIPDNKIPIGRNYRSKVQDCFQSEI